MSGGFLQKYIRFLQKSGTSLSYYICCLYRSGLAYLLVCVRVSAFCDGGSRNFMSEILSMRHASVIFGLISQRCF